MLPPFQKEPGKDVGIKEVCLLSGNTSIPLSLKFYESIDRLKAFFIRFGLMNKIIIAGLLIIFFSVFFGYHIDIWQDFPAKDFIVNLFAGSAEIGIGIVIASLVIDRFEQERWSKVRGVTHNTILNNLRYILDYTTLSIVTYFSMEKETGDVPPGTYSLCKHLQGPELDFYLFHSDITIKILKNINSKIYVQNIAEGLREPIRIGEEDYASYPQDVEKYLKLIQRYIIGAANAFDYKVEEIHQLTPRILQGTDNQHIKDAIAEFDAVRGEFYDEINKMDSYSWQSLNNPMSKLIAFINVTRDLFRLFIEN